MHRAKGLHVLEDPPGGVFGEFTDRERKLRGSRILTLLASSPRYVGWLLGAGASVQTVRSPSEARELIAANQPIDVFMLDAFQPSQCGAAFAEYVLEQQPWCHVFLVAPWRTQPLLTRVERMPNASVLAHDMTQADFMFAVTSGTKCTASAVNWLLKRVSDDHKLSGQQERLLWLNLWGYSDQEIAEALGIQLHTVQDYQLTLRRKTGVRSKGGYLRLLLEYLGNTAPY